MTRGNVILAVDIVGENIMANGGRVRSGLRRLERLAAFPVSRKPAGTCPRSAIKPPCGLYVPGRIPRPILYHRDFRHFAVFRNAGRRSPGLVSSARSLHAPYESRAKAADIRPARSTRRSQLADGWSSRRRPAALPAPEEEAARSRHRHAGAGGAAAAPNFAGGSQVFPRRRESSVSGSAKRSRDARARRLTCNVPSSV
jgi:hypothetical protein